MKSRQLKRRQAAEPYQVKLVANDGFDCPVDSRVHVHFLHPNVGDAFERFPPSDIVSCTSDFAFDLSSRIGKDLMTPLICDNCKRCECAFTEDR